MIPKISWGKISDKIKTNNIRFDKYNVDSYIDEYIYIKDSIYEIIHTNRIINEKAYGIELYKKTTL